MNRPAITTAEMTSDYSFWDAFWGTIGWVLLAIIAIAYIYALFAIITDLFRDHRLNGWWKAVWIIFLIFVPLVTMLVYLVARGGGMAERSAADARSMQTLQDANIRRVVETSTPSASEEIRRAGELRTAGLISEEEFAALKAKALS